MKTKPRRRLNAKQRHTLNHIFATCFHRAPLPSAYWGTPPVLKDNTKVAATDLMGQRPGFLAAAIGFLASRLRRGRKR